MERTQHILIEGLLQTDLIGDVVIEQGEDVEIISSFRRRRHAQHEIGFGEVVNDRAIVVCTRMMSLIDEDVIKIIGLVPLHHMATQRVDCREHILCVMLLTVTGEQTEFALVATEHTLIRFASDLRIVSRLATYSMRFGWN